MEAAAYRPWPADRGRRAAHPGHGRGHHRGEAAITSG
jgi:hypothetical protein